MRKKYWTALETKQRSSADAVKHVAAQGFEVYHPKYRDLKLGGVRAVRALLSNYMFALVDVRRDDWRSLRSTRGVHRVFMTGPTPSVVSDLYIEYMRSREDALGYYVIPECEAPRFSPGQTVRGTRGVFEDQVGIYEGFGRQRDARRIVFEILGRSAEFEVSAYDLEAVDQAA